jgi:hypothetical protein
MRTVREHKQGHVMSLGTPSQICLVFENNGATTVSQQLHVMSMGKLGTIMDCCDSSRTSIENGLVSFDSSSIKISLDAVNAGISLFAVVATECKDKSLEFKLQVDDKEEIVINERNLVENAYIVGLVFRDNSVWKFLPAQQQVTNTQSYADTVPDIRALILTYGMLDPRRYAADDFSGWRTVHLKINEFVDLPIELTNIYLDIRWKSSEKLTSGIALFDRSFTQHSESPFNCDKSYQSGTIDIHSDKYATNNKINILLDQLQQNDTAIFSALCMSKGLFNIVESVQLSLFDSDTKSEIFRTEFKSSDFHPSATSIILCKIHRHYTLNGQGWRLQILGNKAYGRTIQNCINNAIIHYTIDPSHNLDTYNSSQVPVILPPVKQKVNSAKKKKSQAAAPSFFDCINTDDYSHIELKMNILKAENLAAMDITGSSDPYFKLFIDDKLVHTSSVIKKCLNPIWNDNIERLFETKAGRWMYNLRLEFFDKDKHKKDDPLGAVLLQFDMDAETKYVRKGEWLSLGKYNGHDSNKISGQVLIDVTIQLRNAENMD